MTTLTLKGKSPESVAEQIVRDADKGINYNIPKDFGSTAFGRAVLDELERLGMNKNQSATLTAQEPKKSSTRQENEYNKQIVERRYLEFKFCPKITMKVRQCFLNILNPNDKREIGDAIVDYVAVYYGARTPQISTQSTPLWNMIQEDLNYQLRRFLEAAIERNLISYS